MSSQRPSLTSMAAAIVAVAMAIALALLPVDHGAAGASSQGIAVIALDADPSGNGPRMVGTVESCVSAAVGQPVNIDVAIPSPGIPANRGMAAYQFSILYDPTVVWIDADNSDMLLAQAAGSNVIPIAEPKPDRNGVYQSWGIDFGPSGIEPAGSSETGPGVIARITLLPQSNGLSPLTLSGVLIIDDASERISLESVLSGAIHVGEPCPDQSPSLAPSPTPTATPTPSTASPFATTPSSAADTPTPVQGATAVAAFADTGGPPPPDRVGLPWFIAIGLGAVLGGALLLIGGVRRGDRIRRSPEDG